MERVSNRYEIPKRYLCYQELLSDPKIDAVVITTPRKITTSLCIEAITSGKKVFTEKPISLSSSGAFSLLEISRAKNLPVQVGYMRRFDAATLCVQKILKKAFVDNKLIMVRANCFMGDSYASPFGDIKSKKDLRTNLNTLKDKKNSRMINGVFEHYLNVYSHTLDLISYLLNEKIEFKSKILDESGQGIAQFQGLNTSVPIDLATMRSNLNQWIETISFIFNNKIIELNLNAAFLKNVPGLVVVREGLNDDIITTTRPKWSWAFRNQASNFIEICTNWPNLQDNLISAVDQVELVEKMFTESDVR
jgi:hypothetical protein